MYSALFDYPVQHWCSRGNGRYSDVIIYTLHAATPKINLHKDRLVPLTMQALGSHQDVNMRVGTYDLQAISRHEVTVDDKLNAAGDGDLLEHWCIHNKPT